MSHRLRAAATACLVISIAQAWRTASVMADGDPRGGAIGACCDETSMSCSQRDLTTCMLVGGVFLGAGTSCNECFPLDSEAEIYTIEDTFELMASPEATYGSAGALNVSGSQARNNVNQIRGITDTWMKFDPIPAVFEFNEAFGVGGWTLSSAELILTEDPQPNHPIFGIGTGTFAIRWLANDNWSQGTGRPNSPGPTGGNRIGFAYGRSILNGATDGVLGTEFENSGVAAPQRFELPLTPGFLADLMGEGPVTLYFVATETGTGFTFYSGGHNNFPKLVLRAVPNPPCRGELTADGMILGDDIQTFVDAFLNAGGLSPGEFDLIDMDGNGTLEPADIDCFAAALLATHDCMTGPFSCP